MAGVGIDLDLGDVHAVRIGERRFGGRLGVEVFGDLAALFHFGSARGDVEQGDAAVGADDFEMAVLVDDVRLAGFQHGGGDRLALFQDGVHRLDDRMADGHRRARADRGIAGKLVRGIAVGMRNLVRRNAELLGDDARKHRGVALAGILHIERQQQRAVAGKAQLGALDRRAAGMFEQAADAEAAIFAAPLRLAAALLEAVVIGKLAAPCRGSARSRRSHKWCRPRSCTASPIF